jgi:adenosine deaminase
MKGVSETQPRSIGAFVQALPKTETHLHFEGALPLALLQRVRPEFSSPPASWAPGFKYRDFGHFERELLGMAKSWFTSPERYHEAGKVIFAAHAAANVKYVETSIASGSLDFSGLDGREVLEAVRTAAPPGLEVRVFLGIHHDGAGPRMKPVLDSALGWDGLAGIDLHGPEDRPIEPWTAGYWAEAKRAGKYTKAHAGEFMGAGFVRQVLDELQPLRIEHGVRAAESPSVVEELVRRGIALDVCPISNHKLMPGITLASHPIRKLIGAGVRVTISTDDPICFGNTICDEYSALVAEQGFSREELAQVARNGFEVALLRPAEKARWIADIDSLTMGP